MSRRAMTNDPNRLDDPENINRLIGRVIPVSLETAMLMNEFPNSWKLAADTKKSFLPA